MILRDMGRIRQIEQQRDGSYVVEYEMVHYRVLFSDGQTVDVHAVWDDSEMREAVRQMVGAVRIEGVATLTPPADPVPVRARRKAPSKRAASRE